MTASDWFQEGNEFYRDYADKNFLNKAQEILANAVDNTEKDVATQAVDAVEKAMKLFNDAIEAGDTVAGRALEHEGLKQLDQSKIDTNLAEYSKAFFANKPTTP
jgi:predicted transcriptional regulator